MDDNPIHASNSAQFPTNLLDESVGSSDADQRFYTLREALESTEYESAQGSLVFPVGRNEDSKYVIADLHTLPHIMAGGQTGSGKSNFTEGILIPSLLYRNSADDLKLILIDPKYVQFTQYNGIPHLLRPVITTPEDSKEVMDWLLEEMETRFETLASTNYKNIGEYNSSGEGHMPFIVLVIDEVADLMMIDGKYYEQAFIKHLQKSAAVGIHIYIGTSRPSKDVLPDKLRANFLTKIAFTTASRVDSETLIDMSGAEELQGRGDLLFNSLNSVRPVRLQAPYLSDQAISKVVEYLKGQS
jgi:S-DNA-T family DNA segregation ATPase FtsK/SpoIIIE